MGGVEALPMGLGAGGGAARGAVELVLGDRDGGDGLGGGRRGAGRRAGGGARECGAPGRGGP